MLERVWRKGNPLALLVGMEIDTATKRYQLTPVRMTISKKIQTINAEEVVKKCIPSTVSGS